MSEKPVNNKDPEKGWLSLVKYLLSYIPEKDQKMIGEHAAMYIFILTPFILFALVYAGFKIGSNYINKPAENKPCWQLQTIENRMFKINACTGEVVELNNIKQGIMSTTK